MGRKLKMNLVSEMLHYNTHRTYKYTTTCPSTPISRLEVNMHILQSFPFVLQLHNCCSLEQTYLKWYLTRCMECSPTADCFQVLSGVGGKRRNFNAYEVEASKHHQRNDTGTSQCCFHVHYECLITNMANYLSYTRAQNASRSHQRRLPICYVGGAAWASRYQGCHMLRRWHSLLVRIPPPAWPEF